MSKRSRRQNRLARRQGRTARPHSARTSDRAPGRDSASTRSRIAGPKAAWTAYAVMMLLGSAAAMLAVALASRFGTSGSSGPNLRVGARFPVAVGALAAWALGIRCRRRPANRLLAFVDARLGGRLDDGNRRSLQASKARETAVHRLVVSVMALAGGALVALTPLILGEVFATYTWLRRNFLWSAPPMALLHAAAGFAAGLLPLSVLGMAVATGWGQDGRPGLWRHAGWLTAGCLAGWGASAALWAAAPKPEVLVIAAALPALGASLVSALSAGGRAR